MSVQWDNLAWPEPVNRNHPLARGLMAWWIGVPERGRGIYWIDIYKNLTATLANMTPHSVWSQITHGRFTDYLPGRSFGLRGLDFTAASSQYAECSKPVFTDLPCTIAASFRITSASTSHAIVSVGGDTARVQLATNATARIQAQSITSGGTAAQALSSTSYAANEYIQAVAVFTSSTLREIYTNGGLRGTDTTSNVTGSFTRTVIGARYASGSPGAYFGGRILDCQFWNRALNADDVRELRSQYRIGYPDMLNRRRGILGKAAAAPAASTRRDLLLLGVGA